MIDSNIMEPVVPTKTIEMVWFGNSRIYIKTNDGMEYSQPLEVFPTLMYSTPEQRSKYKINKWGDAIRWPEIDEDIHISSFFEHETVNYDNDVNKLFTRFPWLDLKAFAEYLGMHWTKLARFRFGVWTPTPETLAKIKNGIKAIGKEMSSAAL